MQNSMTQMRREVLEIPDAVERLLTDGTKAVDAAADMLRAGLPTMWQPI